MNKNRTLVIAGALAMVGSIANAKEPPLSVYFANRVKIIASNSDNGPEDKVKKYTLIDDIESQLKAIINNTKSGPRKALMIRRLVEEVKKTCPEKILRSSLKPVDKLDLGEMLKKLLEDMEARAKELEIEPQKNRTPFRPYTSLASWEIPAASIDFPTPSDGITNGSNSSQLESRDIAPEFFNVDFELNRRDVRELPIVIFSPTTATSSGTSLRTISDASFTASWESPKNGTIPDFSEPEEAQKTLEATITLDDVLDGTEQIWDAEDRITALQRLLKEAPFTEIAPLEPKDKIQLFNTVITIKNKPKKIFSWISGLAALAGLGGLLLRRRMSKKKPAPEELEIEPIQAEKTDPLSEEERQRLEELSQVVNDKTKYNGSRLMDLLTGNETNTQEGHQMIRNVIEYLDLIARDTSEKSTVISVMKNIRKGEEQIRHIQIEACCEQSGKEKATFRNRVRFFEGCVKNYINLDL